MCLFKFVYLLLVDHFGTPLSWHELLFVLGVACPLIVSKMDVFHQPLPNQLGFHLHPLGLLHLLLGAGLEIVLWVLFEVEVVFLKPHLVHLNLFEFL